jgi:hypothetical protein
MDRRRLDKIVFPNLLNRTRAALSRIIPLSRSICRSARPSATGASGDSNVTPRKAKILSLVPFRLQRMIPKKLALGLRSDGGDRSSDKIMRRQNSARICRTAWRSALKTNDACPPLPEVHSHIAHGFLHLGNQKASSAGQIAVDALGTSSQFSDRESANRRNRPPPAPTCDCRPNNSQFVWLNQFPALASHRQCWLATALFDVAAKPRRLNVVRQVSTSGADFTFATPLPLIREANVKSKAPLAA